MADEAARIAQRLDSQEKALRDLIDVVGAVVKVLEQEQLGDLRGGQAKLDEIKRSLLG